MLLNLLTLGACFSLGALIFAIKLGGRERVQSSAALFITMLAMLLYVLYPEFGVLFGVIAIVSALVYAVTSLRGRKARPADDDH
ncbi:MAG: hypothetical protein PF501_16625 [Salinisphaera sp.]|jgi:hypothetical protein|nr:hypothetical protein [Salinisphaera sp.]